jgi:hypothetical protein
MTNWKLLAEAHQLGISEPELERIVPTLEALDKAFHKVLSGLPADADSSLVFQADVSKAHGEAK